jgi:hypothetical protein
MVGQPADLFAKQGDERKVRGLAWMIVAETTPDHLSVTALAGLVAGTSGDTKRYPMKPWADAIGLLDRSGALCEDQEGALKRILDIMVLSEDTTADGQDHGAVPLDESPECIRVLPGHEVLEQLGV